MVSLLLFMALRAVFHSLLSLIQTAMLGNNLAAMLIFVIIMEENARPRELTVWKYRRQERFLQNQLLGSYSDKMFRNCLKINKQTFFFLCQILRPTIGKMTTPLNPVIDVETRVAVTLHRLATGNTLATIADLYGIGESTASVIVREFCEAMKFHLKPLTIEMLTKERIIAISKEFEAINGIPYILGAIDGSYILITTPTHDASTYYCWKGFYSVILQGVVDADCKFWDYDFGWAGSCHDWTVFQRSQLGLRTLRGEFLPYKLIGDAAYPMRPWFFSPFKGTGLSAEKAHWNFIQSSTRMVVERAFGILKGRWRILLKRIDMPLENIGDIVTACICLHNLCIIHGDIFNEKWAKKVEKEMLDLSKQHLGRLRQIDTFRIATEAIKQMKMVHLNEQDALRYAVYDGIDLEAVQGEGIGEESTESRLEKEEKVKKLLHEATSQHEKMATSFYKAHLQTSRNVIFETTSEEDTE
jgi:hypothetical protein